MTKSRIMELWVMTKPFVIEIEYKCFLDYVLEVKSEENIPLKLCVLSKLDRRKFEIIWIIGNRSNVIEECQTYTFFC